MTKRALPAMQLVAFRRRLVWDGGTGPWRGTITEAAYAARQAGAPDDPDLCTIETERHWHEMPDPDPDPQPIAQALEQTFDPHHDR